MKLLVHFFNEDDGRHTERLSRSTALKKLRPEQSKLPVVALAHPMNADLSQPLALTEKNLLC
jgi:hypothetical protein